METLFGDATAYLPWILLVVVFIGGYQAGLSSAARDNYQNSLMIRNDAGDKYDEASSTLRRIKQHEEELKAQMTEYYHKVKNGTEEETTSH